MSTHRTTWKRRERDAARLFGAKRQVLSGSSGREEATRSDSTHDRLFIETKLRASSSVRSLWEKTRSQALREKKTPVLALYAKGKPGALLVVHEDDLGRVAAELTSTPEKGLDLAPSPLDAEPVQTPNNALEDRGDPVDMVPTPS